MKMIVKSPGQRLLEELFREDRQAVAEWFIDKDVEYVNQIRLKVLSVVSTLPYQQYRAICYRFGLNNDGVPLTHEAVGIKMRIGTARTKQVLDKAFRLLKHPTRMRHLVKFTPFFDAEAEARLVARDAEILSDHLRSLEKWGNVSVDEIEWSVRTTNMLNNANIVDLGQLSAKTERELLKYRNFGKIGLFEVKSELGKWGLVLGLIKPS